MKSIFKQLAADAYALAAVAIFAVYFTLLQWWAIFDPDLISLPWDSHAWAAYWHVKHSLGYLSLFLLWFNLARLTGYARPYLRLAYTLCQWWVLFAFLDLQIGGNWLTGTHWDWWDFGLFTVGAIAALVTHYKLRSQVSDPLEPGCVYIVSRPPRNWIEWAGSVVSWKYGPQSVYVRGDVTSAGIFYGPSKARGTFDWFLIGNDKFSPEPGQVMKRVNVNPHSLYRRFATWDGTKWTPRRNCFKMVKELTRNE